MNLSLYHKNPPQSSLLNNQDKITSALDNMKLNPSKSPPPPEQQKEIKKDIFIVDRR